MNESEIINFNRYLTIKRVPFRQLALLSVLFLLGGFNNLMAQEAAVYRFGVFPHMSSTHMEKKYAPVAVAFAKLLKKPVKLGTASSMDKYRNRVKKGEFDIALISPFDIVPIVDKGGYIPLARRLSKPASIVVTKDSAIKQVEDLQGKIIGLPAGTPVSIVLQLILRERGFVGGKLIHVQEFINVQACLHQLLLKSVDACGSPSGIGIGLKVFQNKMGIKLRSIMKTRAFPHMLFVAHPRLSLTERNTLTQAILGQDKTEQGQKLLQSISKNKHYIPYKNTDYDIIRQYRQNWMKDVKNTL